MTAVDPEALEVPAMLPDHVTGEPLVLAEATDERLVDYINDGAEHIQRVKAHDAAARDELRRRLDRAAKWTRRVGDPTTGVQYEIRCPSPDAGTETFHADELLDVLRDLVGDDVITVEAAQGAIKRTLTITLSVPLDVPADALADVVRGGSGHLEVGGALLGLEKVATAADAHLPGVAKLRKVPDARDALDAIAKTVTPRRTVSIKRIERKA